jgi:hypothetical protein
MSLAKFRKVYGGGESPMKPLGEPPDFRPKQAKDQEQPKEKPNE